MNTHILIPIKDIKLETLEIISYKGAKQISLDEKDIEEKAKNQSIIYRNETKIDGLEAICYQDGYKQALKDLKT